MFSFCECISWIDGTGVITSNTKTTLTKKKLGSYIDNLLKFGLKVPEDLKNVV